MEGPLAASMLCLLCTLNFSPAPCLALILLSHAHRHERLNQGGVPTNFVQMHVHTSCSQHTERLASAICDERGCDLRTRGVGACLAVPVYRPVKNGLKPALLRLFSDHSSTVETAVWLPSRTHAFRGSCCHARMLSKAPDDTMHAHHTFLHHACVSASDTPDTICSFHAIHACHQTHLPSCMHSSSQLVRPSCIPVVHEGRPGQPDGRRCERQAMSNVKRKALKEALDLLSMSTGQGSPMADNVKGRQCQGSPAADDGMAAMLSMMEGQLARLVDTIRAKDAEVGATLMPYRDAAHMNGTHSRKSSQQPPDHDLVSGGWWVHRRWKVCKGCQKVGGGCASNVLKKCWWVGGGCTFDVLKWRRGAI
eukprot:953350-Pelagomonas_calceolata.AAC.2